MGSDLLAVGCVIVICDQANDSRVISKLDDGAGAVGGHIFVREQGVQERAEHAALRGPSVESQVERCGGASLHSLGTVCLKVQHPVT